MKKIIFLLFSSLCLAEFWEDERLIRALTTQTGYSLNEGERIIGIGPLAYGFTDRFMVGTNLILFVNLECRYVIVKEKKTIPAIALGAGYTNALLIPLLAYITAEEYKEDVENIKASLQSYLIWLGTSKRLHSKLIGHGSFNLAITEFKWDVKTKPDKSDPTAMEKKEIENMIKPLETSLTFGTEYEYSKKLRLLTNIGFVFDRLYPFLGAGMIWAAGRTTRIELGLFLPLSLHFDIYWRW